MYEVITYTTSSGRQVFQDWLAGLKDKRASVKITVRLQRLQYGNFGDYKSLGKGLYELRISEGQVTGFIMH